MPEVGTVWTFDYTGGEQTFTVPVSGIYKLETWGAQGGIFNNQLASFGGYSKGEINLKKDDTIYIVAGGQGEAEAVPNSLSSSNCTTFNKGGYNGGGNGIKGCNEGRTSGGGGGDGATHIATRNGTLENIGVNNLSKVLIVSGGGGGSGYNDYNYAGKNQLLGGAGGGIFGGLQMDIIGSTYSKQGESASQTSGYKFGKGANSVAEQTDAGGGGGLYGGYADDTNDGLGWVPGTGGSGYIGNTSLYNKTMYCYNCKESSEESTKTISTTCTSESPTENCSKQGNGYARITLISY